MNSQQFQTGASESSKSHTDAFICKCSLPSKCLNSKKNSEISINFPCFPYSLVFSDLLLIFSARWTIMLSVQRVRKQSNGELFAGNLRRTSPGSNAGAVTRIFFFTDHLFFRKWFICCLFYFCNPFWFFITADRFRGIWVCCSDHFIERNKQTIRRE